jgi:hypothetical protein
MTAGTKRRTTFVAQPPAEQAVCRKCGGHEDVNADGLCQQCLVERVNGAGIFEDDPDNDIFATPRQPRIDLPILHQITCAVCGLSSKIAIGQPGDLCGPCRADLVMTRLYVETTPETARSRLHVLIETFEAAVARESEADQRRWQRVVEARVRVHAGAISAASFRARWAEALAVGDGLSRILAAHEACERGCQGVEQVETWAARVGEELSLC